MQPFPQQPNYGVSFPVSIKLDASGGGTTRLTNVNATAQYKVTQVAVGPTVPVLLTCQAQLLVNGFRLIDTSYFAGGGAAAGGDPPQWLNPGEWLDVVYTGGPASGQVTSTYYYDEIPLSGQGWGGYQ